MSTKHVHINPEFPLAKAAGSEKKMIEKGSVDSRPSVAGRYIAGGGLPKGAVATPRTDFSTEYSSNNAWNLHSSGELNNNYNNTIRSFFSTSSPTRLR